MDEEASRIKSEDESDARLGSPRPEGCREPRIMGYRARPCVEERGEGKKRKKRREKSKKEGRGRRERGEEG